MATDRLNVGRRTEALKELARTRSIGDHKGLAEFSRNPTTWELALLLYLKDNLNISSCIAALSNRNLGYSSIVRFIQEQVARGSLILRPGEKKSEKYIMLCPEVEEALQSYLEAISKLDD